MNSKPQNEVPPRFSVIVPAYNEAASLAELCERIDAVFNDLFSTPQSYELIIINDGSTDTTRQTLGELKTKYPTLRPIHLRRNVGKSLTLMTGFLKTNGSIVFTLDADLQDCPEDIPLLVEKLDCGFDLVSGRRLKRYDTFIRRLGSRLFNKTIQRFTGLEIHDINSGFKAYRAEVAGKLTIYGQFHRYIPLLAHQAGYKVTECAVRNMPRAHGISKYPTFRPEGLFDLLSIIFMNQYNMSPLHFFAKAAAIFIIPSVLIIAYLGTGYVLALLGLWDGVLLGPRPLLSMSLTMFLIGVNIFLTGFVCDFILNHIIQNRIKDLSEMNIEAEE
jgi:glycosyltransferase involved in cell wall biosynthesis